MLNATTSQEGLHDDMLEVEMQDVNRLYAERLNDPLTPNLDAFAFDSTGTKVRENAFSVLEMTGDETIVAMHVVDPSLVKPEGALLREAKAGFEQNFGATDTRRLYFPEKIRSGPATFMKMKNRPAISFILRFPHESADIDPVEYLGASRSKVRLVGNQINQAAPVGIPIDSHIPDPQIQKEIFRLYDIARYYSDELGMNFNNYAHINGLFTTLVGQLLAEEMDKNNIPFKSAIDHTNGLEHARVSSPFRDYRDFRTLQNYIAHLEGLEMPFPDIKRRRRHAGNGSGRL